MENWVFFAFGVLGIVVYIGLFVYILKTWRQRLRDIESQPNCHRLVVNDSDIRLVYTNGVALSVLSLLATAGILFIFTIIPDHPFMSFQYYPFFAMIFLCDIISGPVFVIYSLLSHVKVTDEGISLDSFGNKWLPFGTIKFRWQDVISVATQSDSESTSGIKVVVVTGYYRGQVHKIKVPGHLPDVNLIIEELRRYVSDKFR